ESAAFGGGLDNVAAPATVTDCTFIGNQAIGGATTAGPGGIAQGGGVLNTVFGSLTISHCTFVGNTAQGGAARAAGAAGGLAAGGAIDNYGGTGSLPPPETTVTVTDSTFLANQAVGGRGGAGASGGVGVGGAIAVGQDAFFGFLDSPSVILG